MIRNIKSWFGTTEKQSIALIDSCFIEGTVLKHIEKDKWNVKVKDDFNERFRRLSSLKGIKLCICELNEFEIKSKLRKEYNLPLNKVYLVYDEVMDKLKHVVKIKIDLIKFTPELTKWMLANDLDFKDGLLISIAQKLQIPFVTSERRAEKWKNAYDGVMSDKEFWSKLEKY